MIATILYGIRDWCKRAIVAAQESNAQEDHLGERLAKTRARLRMLASVYVPDAEFMPESEAWLLAIIRDERAADALRLDFQTV